jgi:hypothetical protein
MCYGICKYERGFSGECRGAADWNQPDAACREGEPLENDMRDLLGSIEHNHKRECDFYEGCSLCELQKLAPEMAATIMNVAVFIATHEGPKAYCATDSLAEMAKCIAAIMKRKAKEDADARSNP